MVSISIVYPTCSWAGLTPKSEAKTTHPIGSSETVGSLTAWLNREICILMGQSYIVLFTLPFSQYVYNYYPPIPMVRWHESRLRYNPLGLRHAAPASDLTSFRRRHYRVWLPRSVPSWNRGELYEEFHYYLLRQVKKILSSQDSILKMLICTFNICKRRFFKMWMYN